MACGVVNGPDLHRDDGHRCSRFLHQRMKCVCHIAVACVFGKSRIAAGGHGEMMSRRRDEMLIIKLANT